MAVVESTVACSSRPSLLADATVYYSTLVLLPIVHILPIFAFSMLAAIPIRFVAHASVS